MIFFKTRHEVKQLRREIDFLRNMLVTHFGIKYTMEDFKNYYERHPDSNVIPVTEGEWHHYNEMIMPSGNIKFTDTPNNTHASFRSKRVIIKEDK